MEIRCWGYSTVY